MIITEKVKVRIVGQNIEHYKKLGYDCKYLDSLEVPPIHLTDMSKVKVEVACDKCGSKKTLGWKSYFMSVNSGGYYACSKLCANDKIEQTNILKYGYKNQFQNEEVKEKIKQTNLKNLGVEYPTQSPVVREKIIEVVREKFGVDNVLQSPIIQQKIKDSWDKKTPEEIKFLYDKCYETFTTRVKEIYGVDNIMHLDEFKDKATNTCFKNNGVYYYAQSDKFKTLMRDKQFEYLKNKYPTIQIIEIDKYNNSTLTCDKGCDHTFTINNNLLFKRLNLYKTTLCTVCNDPKLNRVSERELEVYNYIRSLLPTNIEVINSYRIPENKRIEIDIFIPSLNIGFEFNGLYWHSEVMKTKQYHLDKTNTANSYGIKLFHIWEDDFIYKKNILYSIIKNKLGIIENKIQGRKCIIKEVNANDCKVFLDSNHIQGNCQSGIRLGLYDINDELVSVMTFGVRYINKSKSYELLRFSNKINHIVNGAASKLFNHFIKNYRHIVTELDLNEIISYADLAMFNGNLYKTLGFVFKQHTGLNYWWVIGDVRYHRFNFNKRKLVSMGYDINKTEDQIMVEDMKAVKLWGVGMDKYVYSL